MPISSFHEVQFPPYLAYSSTGGPQFNTSICSTRNGTESRNANLAVPLINWNITTAVQKIEDIQTMMTFFRNRLGQAIGFRFKDWFDYIGTQELLTVGTGSALGPFQLYKYYIDDVVTSQRLIAKPAVPYTDANGNVYNGVVLTDVTAAVVLDPSTYTVDNTTGLVTFLSGNAPANGHTINADFQFDIPARFAVDLFNPSYDGYNNSSATNLPIIEIIL